MATRTVKFTPIPDPSFVRDPNLLHLLQALRQNIHAAFGRDGAAGFQPLVETPAATASGSAAADAAPSSTVAKMTYCVFDVSAGVGGAGTHYLNAVLPAWTVLIRAFCVVLESFSGDLGATLGIRAGDGADEFTVFANSALASNWAEGYHDSVSIGQSAGARARAFKAVIAGGDISAGRLFFYAEYVACKG